MKMNKISMTYNYLDLFEIVVFDRLEEINHQTCFYCSEYRKIYEAYPENIAQLDLDMLTPRCHLHWQYFCEYCERDFTHPW